MLIAGCRKKDTFTKTLPEDVSVKFFAAPPNTSNTVKRVIQELKRQNSLTGFINELVAKNGYPCWNKSKLISTRSKDLPVFARGETGGDDTLVLVPMVVEETEFVDAFIAAKINAQTIVLKLYSADAYDDVPFDEPLAADTTVTAEKYALQIMLLDNYLFDRTTFRITDNRLFNSLSPVTPSTTERVLTITQRVQVGDAARLTTEIVTVCLNNYHCTHVPGYCEPRCDMCPQCFTQTCAEFEVDTWYDDDWPPPGGGGSTTGGSGSSSGGDGSTNPCGGNGVSIIQGRLACTNDGGGTLGWTPVYEFTPPCDPLIDLLQKDANFSGKFKSLNQISVTNLTYEKGFMINDRVADNYSPKQGTNWTKEIEWNIPAGSKIDGLLHTHCAGANSIFSPQDVVFMAQIFLDGYANDPGNLYFGMASTFGSPYLMKVSDVSKFQAFAQKIAGDQRKADRFIQQYNNKFNTNDPTKNEQEFLKMIRTEVGDGLKLYSGNNDCNNWSKLSIDNFNDVSTTNCF